MHLDTGLLQRHNEAHSGREVALIRRDDVRAGIARLRRPHRGHHLLRGLTIARVVRVAKPTEESHRVISLLLRATLAILRINARLHCGIALRPDRPAVAVPHLDAIGAHLPDVEQEDLAITRHHVEHRAVRRHRIVDGLTELPRARRHRERQIGAGNLTIRDERNLHRRRAANRLRQQANHVVEVDRRAQATIPPGGVAGAKTHHHAPLLFLHKTIVHRTTDDIEAGANQRMDIEVHRVAEWRREHHGAGRTRLVMVVHHLRIPLRVQHTVHVLGLGLRREIEIAVVVVPDVLLVQSRNVVVAATTRIAVAHVPVGHQLHAVRIRVHHHDDQVVPKTRRLVIIAAHQLPARLNQLIGAEYFSCMQAAVNPHDALPFLGQCAGICLAHAFSARETLGNLPIALAVPKILGTRNDRHHLRTAFRGRADGVEIHTVRLIGESNPVFVELGVVRKNVVGADFMAEEILGGGQSLLRGGRQGQNCGQRERVT